MYFRTYKPSWPISDFVDDIWYAESDEASPGKERILPDGRMQILIDLREDKLNLSLESLNGIGLSGAYSEHFVIGSLSHFQIMGVSFKAGGSFPFFTMPASELVNIHLPLDDLWGPAAAELRERLLGETSLINRFHLVENYLLQRAVRQLSSHPAVTYALSEFQDGRQRTIASVIDRTGFSNRHFIQLFSQEVGLTPKIYCRLLRFREALKKLYRCGPVDLAEIALACGYYDQAHFSNDFKTFSGFSPSAYLAHRGPYINHIALPD
ncbi:MAG: AraC family transcriptional regulator [Blastocatellia bacterium]|nr:AraC family transcriptional regulator [Blastocatellia bacterium]